MTPGGLQYFKMKMKKDKDGYLIVPIVKGHLMIPTKNKEYKIIYNLDIDLFKKDFEKLQGKWGDLFKGKLDKLFLTSFIHHFPEVVYNKLKIDYKKEFSNVDLVKIANLIILKDFPKKKEYCLNVSLDLLKEVKK